MAKEENNNFMQKATSKSFECSKVDSLRIKRVLVASQEKLLVEVGGFKAIMEKQTYFKPSKNTKMMKNFQNIISEEKSKEINDGGELMHMKIYIRNQIYIYKLEQEKIRVDTQVI